ncbi:MAG: hypothetical protein KDB60_09125 [Propionibacteriaceae bacterium]|nr:hypothetical protein [Propionibacteriaceae bacterium]
MSIVGERRAAHRWTAGLAGLALVIGTGLASAPVARADGGDLVAPLPQGPVGALVDGVWDDVLLAQGDAGWYLSGDHGASWSVLGSDTTTVSGYAWLDYLDDSQAAFSETGLGDDNSDSMVWVADTSDPTAVTAYSLPGQDVAAANATTAVVDDHGGVATAVDLGTGTAVPLQTELDLQDWAFWTVGADEAIAVVSTWANAFLPSASTIDRVPLDGAGAGEAPFVVTGGVAWSGFTADGGIDYITLHKTKGATTYQFDYCTRAPAATTSTCGVLKAGIAKSAAIMAQAWKVGNFAQVQVGKYLYATELVRSAKTGRYPAMVKVTGVAPDQGDLTRTQFARLGTGSRPVVTDTTSGTGGVFEVAASGRATRFSEGPTGPMVPELLSLTATRATGLDDRGSLYTAWERGLGSFAEEEVLSSRADDVLASVGRTALNTTSGLVLSDHGVQTARLSRWRILGELSGPYLVGIAGGKSLMPSMLAGSTKVAFPRYEYPLAVFGSTVAVLGWGTTSWQVKVYDVGSGALVRLGTVQIDDLQELTGLSLWGDDVAVSGYTDGDGEHALGRITNFRTGATVWERASDDGLVVAALGDGVAVLGLGEEEAPQLLDPATGDTTSLPAVTGWARPALDGANHVLYATATDLVVHEIPFAGASDPRALWTSAPATFNSWAGESSPWRVSVDATKALANGTLEIEGTGALAGTSVSLPVEPGSADGSLRLDWDGTIGDALAPAGTYTWHLTGFSGLKAVDGTTTVGGTLTVSNKLVAYPQAVPTIDVTKPVTDAVLTAEPGNHPGDAAVGYQWYRGTRAIKGATAQTYPVQPADVGATIKVKVSFSGSTHYLATAKYSKATAKVKKAALVRGAVALGADAPQVDVPFAVAADGWGPEPLKLAYRWYRVSAKGRSTAITGATGATYVPTGSVAGYRLKVAVTASRAGYTTVRVTSPVSTAVLAGSYQVVPTPTISGTAQVGATLTADPGTYLGAAGDAVRPSLRYQWYRVTDAGDVAIRDATRATYKAVAADAGLTLKVRVVAKRSSYPTQTTWSDPTDPVVLGG